MLLRPNGLGGEHIAGSDQVSLRFGLRVRGV